MRWIVNAGKDLVWVHAQLHHWVPQTFELAPDHCYVLGTGAAKTAAMHRGQYAALAIDLEDAFSYVTEEMLFAQMRRQNALSKALKHPKGVLELAAELMTYKGQLPQGCAHSGVAYALAIRSLSQALLGCAKRRGLLLTIYADNMLFSSAQSFWSS